MQQFGFQEIARLAEIPTGSLRSMIRARLVAPAKGRRGALRFSFNDLVLLRTARNLLKAGVAPRRVGAALRHVRSQLPCDAPPRALSVTATAGRVVVHEAGAPRDALSGQLLLCFEVSVEHGKIRVVDTSPVGDASATAPHSLGSCEQAFAAALELEESDVEAAVQAYRACVLRSSQGAARANLGRLLHLQGKLSEALLIYEAADEADANVLYNQAVALEDLDRRAEAIEVYSKVVILDPEFADAHHNLARLLQLTGDRRRALRHWSAYRRLVRAGGMDP